jgi:hypothetical protein
MFLQVVFKKFSSIDESIVLKMHGAFFIQKIPLARRIKMGLLLYGDRPDYQG